MFLASMNLKSNPWINGRAYESMEAGNFVNFQNENDLLIMIGGFSSSESDSIVTEFSIDVELSHELLGPR